MIPFLQDVPYSAADAKRLEPHMGNWLTVHAYMLTLPYDNPATIEELKRMMRHESATHKRLDVLHRLFRRMNIIRRDMEERQLFGRVRDRDATPRQPRKAARP